MTNRPLALSLAALLLAHPLGLAPIVSAARAQTTLPPLQPAPGAAEPPEVVGRIASLAGTVTYRLSGAARFDPASVNLPVTTGTSIHTDPNGEAALGIAGNRIVLGANTAVDVDRLDTEVFAATEGQGESYLHLRELPSGASYVVTTPRGIVTIEAVGRYEVVAGDQATPTAITVLDGTARVTGLPTEIAVGPNQTLLITGDGQGTPFAPNLQPVVEDAFLKKMLADERPLVRPPVAPPALALMTGGDALDGIGEWAETPEYGAAWYPPDPGYVPYRDGRWAFVRPWGWTWVDNAPWGFAPSHYGRWAEIGGRWAWCPGRDYVAGRPPAYAPALVGFIAGAAAGAAAGALVGWAPLGPREPYRPAFARSAGYLQALNAPVGAPFRGPVVAPVNIVNRNAITVVPHNVFINSAPVAAAARPVPAGFEHPGRALEYRPALEPTAATFGAARGPGGPAGFAHPAAVVGGAALAGAVAGAALRPPLLHPEGGREGPHEQVLEGRGPANILNPGAAPRPGGPIGPQGGRPEAAEFARPGAAQFARPGGQPFAHPPGAEHFGRPGGPQPGAGRPAQFARPAAPQIVHPGAPQFHGIERPGRPEGPVRPAGGPGGGGPRPGPPQGHGPEPHG